MSKRITELKKKQCAEWWLDVLSLGAVLQYCAYRFLQSTMFNFYYSNTYKIFTMILLLAFGGIRYLYVLVKKWNEKEKEERKKFLLHCFMAWILALPFFYVGWKQDYKILIFLPICCMCLYGMKAEKVFKAFTYVIGTLLAATMLCSLSGTVRNLVYADNGRVVGSYGIINTTDFASYFTFLLLILWCGMKRRCWYQNIIFATVSVVITYIVFLYTGSRTALYCVALFVFYAIWETIREKKKIQRIEKSIDWITIFAFPLIGAAVIFLTVSYGQQMPWAVQLNTSLSGRLKDTLNLFGIYGINPFGALIENAHGRGATQLSSYWSSGYGYLDVAYAMSAIKYGWVITAIIAGFWIWTTIKAIKCGNKKVAFVMAILAAHAFSEARVWDINYNIFLAMPFCAFETEKKETSKDKNAIWASAAAGVIVLVGSYLILARMLSWLRTLFAIKEWNSGTASFNSLVFCLLIVILLLLLWKTLSVLLRNHSKRAAIIFISAVAVIVGCVLAVNGEIEKTVKEQKTRLDAEERIIKKIQEVSTQPVYAAESSELFSRRFGGFEDHLFSTEELSRNKGTIITNSGVEAFSLVTMGGLYTQISETSDVYTYDKAVADALTNEGFVWSTHYSGKHVCNLKDTAVFNGLKAENLLELDGPVRIVTSNAEMDQLGGEYEVTFTLSGLCGDTDEASVAVLEVVGDSDEKVLQRAELYASDFGEDGRCVYVVKYVIGSTPKVSYAVSVPDGVRLSIEDVSWTMTSRCDKTDGTQIFADDSILMTTDVPDNIFSMIHLQLYDAVTNEYLLDFGRGTETGVVSGDYVHNLEDGFYYIRLKGNTNLADEWIRYLVYLSKDTIIHYSYSIEEFDSSHIQVRNFQLEKQY